MHDARRQSPAALPRYLPADAPAALDRAIPRPSGRVLTSASWLVAMVGVAFLAWLLQIRDRSPYLVWDEATRVKAGSDLSFCVASSDLGCAWHWLNAQTFYPFLMPLLHGGLISMGLSSTDASWLPSLACYALAGYLCGRLVTTLGGRQAAAWLAALLYWLCPFVVRLAAWGAVEHVAACIFLSLTLLMVSLERHPTRRLAIAAGLVTTLAWFLKWDYGILASAGLFISILLSSPRRAAARSRSAYALALGLNLAIVAGWLAVNFHAKLVGLFNFTFQGASYHSPERNPLYYVLGLFDSEVGLAPLAALMLIGGLVWACWAWRRRELPNGALVLPLLGLGLYSMSEVKHLRYLAPLVPSLAVFAALAVERLAARARRLIPTGSATYVALAALMLVAGWQLVGQIDGAGGLLAQNEMLSQRPAVGAVLDFVTPRLQEADRPALLLGWTNQLNPAAFDLAWSDSAGHAHPAVYLTGSVLNGDGEATLLKALSDFKVALVVGVDVGIGSSLDNADDRLLHAQEPDYLAIARQLEARGLLVVSDSEQLEDGAVKVTIWRVAAAPAATRSPD